MKIKIPRKLTFTGLPVKADDFVEVEELAIRVPTSENVIECSHEVEPYEERLNDIQRLERLLKAMLDVMSPRQRLDVINNMRGREPRQNDWPYFVAEFNQ